MKKAKKIFKSLIVFFIICVFSSIIFLFPISNYLYADNNQIKIFIDPGHGGRDPGAVRHGLQEKAANLTIALKLKSKLEANGFVVIMSRTNDSYHSLDQIVNMANSSGADIFLSIHNNASVSSAAHGTETFWCSNGVNGSSQLASTIQSSLLSQIGTANRGVKTANFRVIKNTNMPAALVECAFVSNPYEAELLKNDGFLEKCATGLYNAINSFAQGIDKSTGHYTDNSSENSAGLTMYVDYPKNNAVISRDFYIAGWAADINNIVSTGVSKIEIYDGFERNDNTYLGTASTFERQTLVEVFNNPALLNSGYICRIDQGKLSKGEHLVYVFAYDTNNNYSYAAVKLNITNIDIPDEDNAKPIANPGGPHEGLVGEDITFNGSGSTDSDGEVTEYNWSFGDESTGSGVSPVHSYSEAGTYTVALTVKDNGAAVSTEVSTTAVISEESESGEDAGGEGEAEEEAEEETVSQFGVVSNSTNVIGNVSLTVDDLVRIFEDKNSSKVDRARRIAPIYIQYSELFNMRVDIAWAQMIHETGFLEYTGDVSPDQNNFVGIGATGGGVPGNSFATEELGIIAHFAHLAWYYHPDHVNEYCNSTYDPRHFGSSHYRYTGDTTLGFLNGRWAPGATYTGKIVLFANQILQGADGSDPEEEIEMIAEAGEDQSGDVGDTLDLDASGSTIPLDSDTVVNYSWDWDGDGQYDETVQEAVVSHQFDEAGIFEAGLKIYISGDEETFAIDSLTVTVNDYPVADPGGPYEGMEDEEISFDGLSSIDNDGEIVEYQWDFGDGSVDTESGANPVHTYNEAGTYTVTLIVKDDSDALSTAVSTTATVSEDTEEEEEPVNEIPDANPGDPYEGVVDREISFDGLSSIDNDGEIVEYLWDFGDGNTGAGVSPTHIYSEADTYTVTLTVVDDSDASSTAVSTTATVNEDAEEEDPEETEQTVIANAGEDKNGFVGDTVTFDASESTVSPPSETTVTYSWDFNGDGQYDETVQEAAVTHQFNGAGTFTVSLKVAAFDNIISTDTVTVTISENVNNSPTANPGGPYEGIVGEMMTFNGSGSNDSDGTIVEYQWNFGDSIVSTESGPSVTHIYSAAGTFTMSLVVKDDDGASSSAATTTVVISEPPQVNPVNREPITNATSVVGYTEVSVDQLVQIFVNRGSSKVDWARRIAPIYIQYGKLFDLRADIAWAMMCHETGFLEYTGDVRPDQNNFCGMGAIGGGDPGNSFATEELGIIAQYAHMAWYYYPDHVNQYCNSTYDPRHFGSYHYRYTGNTTLGFLNGNWAPGATYTGKIILFANQIYGF